MADSLLAILQDFWKLIIGGIIFALLIYVAYEVNKMGTQDPGDNPTAKAIHKDNNEMLQKLETAGDIEDAAEYSRLGWRLALWIAGVITIFGIGAIVWWKRHF